jgi:hypothetical protein
MNLATLLEGPANLTHRGQFLKFKGGLTVTPLLDVFNIETDMEGVIDKRALERSIIISGTPTGVMDDDLLGMTHRWTNPKIGSLLTPRYDVSAVDASADTLTLVGSDAPRTGCLVEVAVFPGGTLPAGLAADTPYYWGAAGTLHDTEAHAIANTNKIDITDAGSGDFAIIEQEYIQIDAVSANRRLLFHNGAVSDMPPIIQSAVQTLFGPMSFAIFPKNNRAWSAANNLYTVSKVALTDTASDKTTIPTQEYTGAFGASPWDSFKLRGPATTTPKLSTQAISTDGRGNVGLQITGLNVSTKFIPQGLSHQQMLDLLQLQGGTVARGKSQVRDDLVISGTGVYVTVYNGTPKQLPQTFQTTGPLAGELEIEGAIKPGTGYFRVATTAET